MKRKVSQASGSGFVPLAKGGVRQRREALSQGLQSSSLVEHLLSQWSWGHMSPQQVQCFADKFETDLKLALEGKLDTSEIKILAGLGSRGEHPNNCNRDLMQHINPPALEKAIGRFDVPMKTRAHSLGTTMRSQAIVLPHAAFATLYHDHRLAFNARVLGGSGQLQAFWRAMEGSPNITGHPIQQRAGHMDVAIPLALHGDGVPVTGEGKAWSKSVDSFAWSSLVGSGATLDTHMLIYAVFTGLMSKRPGSVTMDKAWRIIWWSLYWLWVGKWPDRDHDDKPYPAGSEDARRALTDLAGGFYGVVWTLRGDLDYYAKSLGLNMWNTSHPCVLCPANVTPGDSMAWSCFRPEAQWIDATWGNEAWRQDRPEHHQVFDLPGVGITSVAADWLHTKHLGVDQYFFGSMLHLLVFSILPGSPDDNMQAVWGAMQQFLKDTKTKDSFSGIRVSMFSNTASPNAQFPRLKGKGAEVRNIGPALEHAFRQHMDPQSTQHKQIALGLRMSVRMEELLTTHADEWKLPPDAAREMTTCATNYAQLATALANHYNSEGRPHVVQRYDQDALHDPWRQELAVLEPAFGVDLLRGGHGDERQAAHVELR